MREPRCVVVVQARMGSSRFPGKALHRFGDTTLLQQAIRRVGRMRTAADVVVATSTEPGDDAIVEVARAEGVAVTRGSEEDVLQRFVGAVDAVGDAASVVVRICADRPLLCPRLADDVVGVYAANGSCDYASNTQPKTFPDGLDVEAFSVESLRTAARESREPSEREHVTPFLYRHPERFSLANVACPYGDFSHVRATVDHESDLVALERVHMRLTELVGEYDWRDVVLLALTDPTMFPAPPDPGSVTDVGG